jgi:predicted CoA-binding protein
MDHNLTSPVQPWRSRLLESPAQITHILETITRVAVIGIKPAVVGGPAYYVPEYMQAAGYEIIPIPVYYSEITEILGCAVHRSLTSVTPAAEMIVLFRRPKDVPLHVTELLAAKPRVVWMQLGIRHDAVAEALATAGIEVVQDKCIKIELERMRR